MMKSSGSEVGICIYRPFTGNEKAKEKAVEKGKDSLSYYHYHKFDKKYDELIEQAGRKIHLPKPRRKTWTEEKGKSLPWQNALQITRPQSAFLSITSMSR
ncbi:hypothetical protein C823_007552 [Eubacterium plexicaudatum ASF492]|nr:hypothetical protein C823_007552 [Eubacterium plexicaudatum ASF492]